MAYGPPPTAFDPTNVMGRRITAWIIDIMIPTIVAIILGYIVFIGAATKISGVPTDYCTFNQRPTNTACVQVGNDAYIGTRDDVRAAFTVGGLVYLVGALNLFVVQGLTGATVGKHILGLRVIKADGAIAGFGANAGRSVLLVVDQFFCALVGLITASVTHPHRRVGDMAAGTFVVAKESVGTPVGAAMGAAYAQPWMAPSAGTGWGPPPAGGTQTWGPPTAAVPAAAAWPRQAEPAQPASTAPPAWGTPAASPPPAETPSTWGTPAPAQAATPPAATPPEAEAPVTTPEDAPGWASPNPAPTEPTPAPAAVQPAAVQPAAAPAPAREPQWDSQRDAWVFWEVETSRWLQFDAATGQWGPLR